MQALCSLPKMLWRPLREWVLAFTPLQSTEFAFAIALTSRIDADNPMVGALIPHFAIIDNEASASYIYAIPYEYYETF